MSEHIPERQHRQTVMKKCEEFFLTLETGEKGDRQLYKLKRCLSGENFEFGIFEKQIKVNKDRVIIRFIDQKFKNLIPERLDEKVEKSLSSNELVYMEEEFSQFSKNLDKVFTDPKSKFYIDLDENYIIKELDKCKTIKQKCEILKNIFISDQSEEKFSIQSLINNALKFENSDLKDMKYLINCMTYNFTRKFYSQFNELHNIRKLYKYIKEGRKSFFKGNIIISSSFFTANIYGDNLEDNDVLNSDGESTFIIKLAPIYPNDQTTNYIRIPEDEVLFCPFTKFKITEIKTEDEKTLVYMEEIKENYFVDYVYSFLIYPNLKENNLYQKLLIYYQNEVIIISSLFSDNSNEAISSYKRIEEFLVQAREFEYAIGYAERSLRYINKKSAEILFNYLELAEYYANLKNSNFDNFLIAIEYANKARDKLSSSENSKELGKIHKTFGEVHKLKKEYEKALEHYENSLSVYNTLYSESNLNSIEIILLIVEVFMKINDFQRANEYLQRAIKAKKEIHKKDEIDEKEEIARFYIKVSSIYNEMSNEEKVLECLNGAKEIIENVYDQNSKEYALHLIKIADYYFLKKKSDAIQFCEQAMSIIKEKFKEGSHEFYSISWKLGKAYYYVLKYKSLVHLENFLIHYMNTYGEYSQELCNHVQKLGEFFNKNDDIDKAQEFFGEVSRIKKHKMYIEKGDDQINQQIFMAEYNLSKGDIPKAIGCYESEVIKKIENNGDKTYELAELYRVIEELYLSINNYKKSLEYLKLSLAIRIRVFGENSVEVAKDYVRLTRLYKYEKNFNDSNNMLSLSIKIKISLFGEQCLCIAKECFNLGMILSEIDKNENLNRRDSSVNDRTEVDANYKLAASEFERSLKIISLIYKEKSDEYLTELDRLGEYHNLNKQDKKYLDLLEKSLKLKEEMFKHNQEVVVEQCKKISKYWEAKQNVEQSVKYFQRAVEIIISLYTEESDQAAKIIKELGDVCSKPKEKLGNYEKSLNILIKIYGPDHEIVGKAHQNIGDYYLSKKKKNTLDAIPSYIRNLEIMKLSNTVDKLDIANQYRKIGKCFIECEKYLQATEYLEEALNITKKYGQKKQLLKEYKEIFKFYKELGKLLFAIKYAEKILNTKKELFNENSKEVAKQYNTIAECYRKQGEFSFAFDNYNASLGIKQTLHGHESIQVAEQYKMLANCYIDLKRYSKAEEYYDNALELLVHLKEEDKRIEHCLSLGDYYKNTRNDIIKAESFYKMAIKVKEEKLGKQNSADYLDIANRFKTSDHMSKALEYYSQCINVEISKHSRKSIQVANVFYSVGEFYFQFQKDFDQALLNFNKSLDIKLEIFQDDDSNKDLSDLYRKIGDCYNMKLDNQAIEFYTKSLKIKINKFTENNDNVVDDYIHIGDAYKDQKNFLKAIENYEKSLKIQKNLDKFHDRLGETYKRIGTVHEINFDYYKALTYYKMVKDICKDNTNYEDYDNLARIYIHIHDNEKAQQNYRNAEAILKNNSKEINTLKIYSYHSKGVLALYSLEFKNAVECFENKIIELKKMKNDECDEIAHSYTFLALAYQRLLNITKAIEYYEKATKIYVDIHGEDNSKVLENKLKISNLYILDDNLDMAFDFLNKYYQKINEKKEKSWFAFNVINSYGFYHLKKKGKDEKKKAKSIFGESQNILKDLYPETHFSWAVCYTNFGKYYFENKDYPSAIENYNKALDIYNQIKINFDNERMKLKESLKNSKENTNVNNLKNKIQRIKKRKENSLYEMALIKIQLVELYLKSPVTIQNLEISLKYSEEVIQTINTYYKDSHEIKAECFFNIGKVYDQKLSLLLQNEESSKIDIKTVFENALKHYREVEIIYIKIYGDIHYLVALINVNLACLLQMMGKFEKVEKDKKEHLKESEECYKKAKKIRESVLDKGHIDTGDLYYKMGIYYKLQENYMEAREFFSKALAIREKHSLLFHMETAVLYENIAEIEYQRKDYEEALGYYNKSLELFNELESPLSRGVANIYNTIGLILSCQTKYSKSLENFHKAKEIYLKLNMEKSIYFADVIFNIANIYKIREEFKKALTEYLKVKLIYEKELPQNDKVYKDIRLVKTYAEIGFLYYSLSEYNMTLEFFKLTLNNFFQYLLDQPNIEYELYELIYYSMYMITQALEDTIEIKKFINNEKKNRVTIVECYLYISAVYYKLNEIHKSEYFDKILKNYMDGLSKSEMSTPLIYFQVAKIYDQYNTDKANQYYESCLILFNKNNKHKNVHCVNAYFCCAEICFRKGDNLRTIEHYQRALKINEKIFGEEDEMTKKLYHKLSKMYMEVGIDSKAMDFNEKIKNFNKELPK